MLACHLVGYVPSFGMCLQNISCLFHAYKQDMVLLKLENTDTCCTCRRYVLKYIWLDVIKYIHKKEKSAVDANMLTSIMLPECVFFTLLPFRTLAISVNPLPYCHRRQCYLLHTHYLTVGMELVYGPNVFPYFCVNTVCPLWFVSTECSSM
jgi:hypothetical protein